MSEYMWVLALAGIIPFLLSFLPFLKFYKNIKALFFSLFFTVLLFGAWDIFAVWRQHWYFEPFGVGNIKIANLPLEEVLFFIVIPFCCIFTWEAVRYIKTFYKE